MYNKLCVLLARTTRPMLVIINDEFTPEYWVDYAERNPQDIVFYSEEC